VTRSAQRRAPLRSDRAWMAEGACVGKSQLFFAPNAEEGRPRPAWSAEPAKAVCGRCPVRDACRDWALRTHQDHGVWGGLDEVERRALRRRARNQTGAGSPAERAS
jgi:WhiB family redox-sensing transcriptional regulator